MDKKLFAELMESLQQMAAHAAGKKVKGVREVTKELKSSSPLSKKESSAVTDFKKSKAQ